MRRHKRALAEIFNPFGSAPDSPAGPEDSPAVPSANTLGGETKSPKCLGKEEEEEEESSD